MIEGKKIMNFIKSCHKIIKKTKNKNLISLNIHEQFIILFLLHIRYIVIEKQIFNILIKTTIILFKNYEKPEQ
jgi:hypothetical protein